jgi:hypothetical protein
MSFANVVFLLLALAAVIIFARLASRPERPALPQQAKELGWGWFGLEMVIRAILAVVPMWSVSGPIDVRIDHDH